MSTTLPFSKYHGAGNDFVLIDARAWPSSRTLSQNQIAKLCSRHTGIGADGLMLLQKREDQLQMVYFNSDGAPSSFCGNGSRCFLAFAQRLGLVAIEIPIEFNANDGAHTGLVLSDGSVRVSMRIASEVRRYDEASDVVNTGSPHFINWCEVLPEGDITSSAREVRYSSAFAKTGVNVNYVLAKAPGKLSIRTYERGVEAETLACGTGVTAAALSYAQRQQLHGQQVIWVKALGGDLRVYFDRNSATGSISDVWLEGPAKHVFEGSVDLS